MPRYRFAPNGGAYSDPRRLGPTLAKIRTTAKRDGKGYSWQAPHKGWTRRYRTVLGFMVHVAISLRKTRIGAVSRLATRVDHLSATSLDDNSRVYNIRTIKKPPPDLPGDKAIEAAMGELGTVYRFGVANGPEDPGSDAFDCSGLTQWAWQQAANVTLPHNANAQKDSSLVSLFFDQKRAARGDLVFMWFENSRGIVRPDASHVGLFYSHPSTRTAAQMLDTRSPSGEPVAIRPIEEASVVGYGRVRVA